MTIKVSTDFSNSVKPSSANLILFLPSNWNGFVTQPTVKIPLSLAA